MSSLIREYVLRRTYSTPPSGRPPSPLTVRLIFGLISNWRNSRVEDIWDVRGELALSA